MLRCALPSTSFLLIHHPGRYKKKKKIRVAGSPARVEKGMPTARPGRVLLKKTEAHGPARPGPGLHKTVQETRREREREKTNVSFKKTNRNEVPVKWS